jgi:hypothetical protein
MEFFKSAVGKKWAALGKKNLALWSQHSRWVITYWYGQSNMLYVM